MRARELSPQLRLIIQAVLFWVTSIMLGGMVLDGGVLLKFYVIASFCLWPALFLFAYRRRQWSATESAVFRASPFLLFIACFVIGAVVMGLRGE